MQFKYTRVPVPDDLPPRPPTPERAKLADGQPYDQAIVDQENDALREWARVVHERVHGMRPVGGAFVGGGSND